MYIQIVVIVICLIIILGLFVWQVNTPGTSIQSWWNQTQNKTIISNDEINIIKIKELLGNDSCLHRLLMIEIINSRVIEIGSEKITYDRMTDGMKELGKILVRFFGTNIAQRISSFMNRRNELLREYYLALRKMNCDNGNCTVESQEFKKSIIRPVFPDGSNIYSIDTIDITTITLRKLEDITREITDTIGAAFHIRDIDSTINKKRPIIHYQRLYNLLTMYDKEIINQAKSYSSHNYEISMNCSQSAFSITRHLSDEFNELGMEMQKKQDIIQVSHI